MKNPTIQFCGAAQTVTGSKYFLEFKNEKILVDCGLFQGLKELRLLNRKKLPFDPRGIKAILLTHAHLDHSGAIPLLVKLGFRGKIYCTPATFSLCEILLPDSGYLQEEDSDFANAKGFSKHQPALPLYTYEDAQKSLQYFKTVPFYKKIDISKNISFSFLPAGHILGASQVELNFYNKKLLFSGDLGRFHDLIMKPPVFPTSKYDSIFLESTYGNKVHCEEDVFEKVITLVKKVIDRNGVILIPAFAVGRAQALLYLFYKLKKDKKIPDIPVYLNSPMAKAATRVFLEYSKEHKLSREESEALWHETRIIHTVTESKELNFKTGPKIIISASGMATGGRILHHMKAFCPHPENLLLFSGFQAAGTRGEAILRGVESVKIHGEYVPIRCEVENLDSLSAHADQKELFMWLKKINHTPKNVFLTHGEPLASDELRHIIKEQLGWNARSPLLFEKVEL